MSKVVHCRRESFDVYIGRRAGGMHFGNPFSHLSYGLGLVKVKTRDEAIKRFSGWLAGTSDQTVEPERREWILAHVHELKGKTLGCYCSPAPCHGTILAQLAEKEITHV